ncbi:deoxyuridine 5'-triphosphate nucleotidohydrolase family protein [Trichomonas vaginalis G3]|uniref:Deoxyuridine 5'-triphosphate nucleotidohydrolase n=1 Tax=Trichomonas vaginalis (strain ATCC PRA-98 / G3) TaxID=412133 RepID=A2E7K8_TRIV3|nr:dUTP metabolic process [Trichomonas vaginalis G3]EAY11401.1 deoxyuridine 5'-triphosphate nucleotidohydrolase family protein [Trichomonas vaginalis G3]KAI5530580.1 dUTP metabolic process [Trichomonas vaginalis G3]|eukprot:XP_001323624.1 deoxyuridine 5'-triphosphate nucleotidohydrolase family protein [Trichomonas vaginalis G3]
MSNPYLEAIAKTIDIKITHRVIVSATVSDEILSKLNEIPFNAKPVVENHNLLWYGSDGLFLVESLWEYIQKTQNISLTFAQKYGRIWSALRKTPTTLQVSKIVPEAIIPSKAHPLDTGYDISVIRVVKENFGPGVTLYGTGLIIRPPDGYYVDMVARSSLCKSGYFVANCVGIIDAQYRGELCVPLAKISPDAKPLELPARIVQIIIRELHVCDIEEVADINSTSRGTGGFGSSGK